MQACYVYVNGPEVDHYDVLYGNQHMRGDIREAVYAIMVHH